MRCLTVYAHPDDESFGPAALFAQLASRGAELHGVWFTCGERGQPVPDLPPGNLADMRADALREVSRLIGYKSVTLLDFGDGSLAEQPELEQIVLFRLVELRPEVVFTFGPAGITRHPDHIAVHRATVAAFHHAHTAQGVPLRGLYFDAVPHEDAAQMGIADEPEGNPNTFIDVGDFQHVKRAALAVHARYVADARERLVLLDQKPLPIEPLFRGWPAVPQGVQLRTID
jgi:N-acetylglucosamine malate deacetylase 2